MEAEFYLPLETNVVNRIIALSILCVLLAACEPPPSPENPIVETSADTPCVGVVVGMDLKGEVTVPCEGEWQDAHLDPSFRKRHVAPRWMVEAGSF